MTRAKYIIIDNGTTDTPIVFPGWLTHSDMARSIGGKVLSAGFVEFWGDEFGNAQCSVMGESISLKTKPGKHDERLIAQALGLEG
jgi:hypothetical protein